MNRLLENVGKSIKYSLNAISVEVMWAPIGTPKFKSLVESLIGKINRRVWHRAPGGIPFKPHVMSALRLRPKTAAEWTLEYANDVIHFWLVTIYHVEMLESIRMAPARKWAEGLTPPFTRPVLARPELLDDVFGRVEKRVLTERGVSVDRFEFHDHAGVTSLYAMLGWHVHISSGRAPHTGSASIPVNVVVHEWDSSYVSVENPVTGEYVRLYNTDPRIEPGTSWAVALEYIRENDDSNQAYHSHKEAAINNREFNRMLEGRASSGGPGAKDAVRKLAHQRGTYAAPIKSPIKEEYETASPNGWRRPATSPQVAAVGATSEPIAVTKGAARGKPRGRVRAKVAETPKPAKVVVNEPSTPATFLIPSAHGQDDYAAVMARVRAKMEERQK